MPRIVVHPDAGVVTRTELLERRPGLNVVEPQPDSVGETLASTGDPVVFLCDPLAWDDSHLEFLSEGDWVVTIGVGYDAYPVDEFERRGVLFSNSPGIAGEAISEHVFGMAFAFSRRLLRYRDLQRANEWERGSDLTDFAGDVCCVVGLGHVGEAIAERARAFRMTVRGVKRTVSGYDGAAQKVYPSEELHTALEGARLVVLCVPLTDETRGLVGTPELAACADDAVVVNVARGPVLQTDALIEALDRDELYGAGLDVFDEEPLPSDSALWGRNDVLITPHRGSVGDKYSGRLLDVFLEQYDRWRADTPLDYRIV